MAREEPRLSTRTAPLMRQLEVDRTMFDLSSAPVSQADAVRIHELVLANTQGLDPNEGLAMFRSHMFTTVNGLYDGTLQPNTPLLSKCDYLVKGQDGLWEPAYVTPVPSLSPAESRRLFRAPTDAATRAKTCIGNDAIVAIVNARGVNSGARYYRIVLYFNSVFMLKDDLLEETFPSLDPLKRAHIGQVSLLFPRATLLQIIRAQKGWNAQLGELRKMRDALMPDSPALMHLMSQPNALARQVIELNARTTAGFKSILLSVRALEDTLRRAKLIVRAREPTGTWHNHHVEEMIISDNSLGFHRAFVPGTNTFSNNEFSLADESTEEDIERWNRDPTPVTTNKPPFNHPWWLGTRNVKSSDVVAWVKLRPDIPGAAPYSLLYPLYADAMYSQEGYQIHA